jgi:hypothetical protein
MYNILLGKGRVVSFKDRSMQKRGGHNKARSVNIEHVGTYYILHEGLAKTIYIRCLYGVFGREITKYTVYKYGFGQP